MRNIYKLLLLAVCTLPMPLSAQEVQHSEEEIQSLLIELDTAIYYKINYQSDRLEKADMLEEEADTCSGKDRVKKLKELYSTLERFDGKRALDVLAKIEEDEHYKDDPELFAWVHLSRAKVYGTMGLYHKAGTNMRALKVHSLPPAQRLEYYLICQYIFTNISDYISDDAVGQEEGELKQSYLDSILSVQPEGIGRKITMANKELLNGNTEEALYYANQCLGKAKGYERYGLYMTLADIYKRLNDEPDHIYYLAKISIEDIKSGYTDYLALPQLVSSLYESEDIDRAYNYLISAMEDANFYPARTLAASVSNYFPLINRAYDSKQSFLVQAEKMKRNSLAIAYAMMALAICVTFYLGWRFNNAKVQQRRADELQKALDQASVADRVKTVFIQNMRHEIRTPLNSIMGFAQLMSNDLSDEERSLYNKYIQESNNQLLATLDDIIDVSNMEVGTFNFIFEDLDVDSLCLKRMDNNRELLSKGVEFVYDPQPKGLILYSDRKRISQVLDNLISNACKNTIQGTITVSVTQVRQKIQFVVTDTGKGIPADKANLIFEHFEKLDHYSPGLGLGLYVGRLIARALGGDIRLDTRYRNGARFVFTVSNKKRDEVEIPEGMMAMRD